ncbi:flagellar biosynthetic protein FliO [Microbacterium sp. Marseille-Q6965]|uniref:FliO/MopB family protein n=1 Tax=Microbacterium sp. Marseille-Q6965 TaxID=2965072 RepID=UPI0021B72B22|nr:flagellar biosynthetic protein FliO [Microbacterium sp. Marseille-Q6965]
MLGALWYLQRRFSRGAKVPRDIAVVSRQALGGKAQLIVVDVEGTRYVLGVTEQGVNVIDRIRSPHQITASVEAASAEPSDATGAEAPAAALPDGLPLRRDRSRRRTDPLHGSILSPSTWRQTAEALRRAR